MASQTTAGEPREHRHAEKPDKAQAERSEKAQIVVVDLSKRQTPKEIRRLRRGQGKLMRRIHGIIDDLVAEGTVKSTAQPIVLVVREELDWHFGYDDDEDDDDDDED
jgi:hypothetical protein